MTGIDRVSRLFSLATSFVAKRDLSFVDSGANMLVAVGVGGMRHLWTIARSGWLFPNLLFKTILVEKL